MKSIWQDESRQELNERRRALSPGTTRAQWGKFTAPKMVCHLADSLEDGDGRSAGRAQAPADPLSAA